MACFGIRSAELDWPFPDRINVMAFWTARRILPAAFAGWDFHADYSQALGKRAGRAIPLVAGNDGNYGGVAEAAKVRGGKKASVVMLAPGSGLGAAYINPDGLPLDGDTLAGMEAGHMPAPLHLLGLPPFTCGCGRTWGCFEAYTALSGLPAVSRLSRAKISRP